MNRFLSILLAWAFAILPIASANPLVLLSGNGNGAEQPIVFSLVQEAHVTGASSSTTVPIPLSQPLGAGNLLIVATAYTGNNVEVVSVDKGGTLIPIVATSGGAGFGDSSGSCGYIVTTTAASSPITVTYNGPTGGCSVSLWEFAYTGGIPVLDSANRFSSPSGATAQGPALNLSSSNCLIVQTTVQTASATAITNPYNAPTGYSTFPGGLGFAAVFNTASGAAPTWTYGGSSNAGMSAVAFGKNPQPFLTQTFCDFEAGADGANATPANLLASTKGWTAGRWRLGGTGGPMKLSSAASRPLVNATGRLNDGGNYAAGLGSLGIEFDTDEVQSYVVLDYAASAGGGSDVSNQNSFSSGIWFYSSLPNTDETNADVYSIYAGGGLGFANAKFRIHPSGTTRCLELEIPGGSSGGTISISSAQWYWLTLQYNRSAPHKLRVYDASLNFVGELSEAHIGSGMPGNVQFGQSASNTPTPGHVFRFDSVKVDPTGAFPVLP